MPLQLPVVDRFFSTQCLIECSERVHCTLVTHKLRLPLSCCLISCLLRLLLCYGLLSCCIFGLPDLLLLVLQSLQL